MSYVYIEALGGSFRCAAITSYFVCMHDNECLCSVTCMSNRCIQIKNVIYVYVMASVYTVFLGLQQQAYKDEMLFI